MDSRQEAVLWFFILKAMVGVIENSLTPDRTDPEFRGKTQNMYCSQYHYGAIVLRLTSLPIKEPLPKKYVYPV